MIIAIIPAKGGSKRLPNKNMYLTNGKPLIEYAFEYIKKSKHIDCFYVTTDNDNIEKYCLKNKVNVIKRPQSLGGETPLIDVYKHLLNQIAFADKIDILLGIQIDHPDRNVSLDAALKIFKNKNADRLSSIDKDGKKNGAHNILSKYFLDTNISRKDLTIIDDCTNIHYKKDLLKAEKKLKNI